MPQQKQNVINAKTGKNKSRRDSSENGFNSQHNSQPGGGSSRAEETIGAKTQQQCKIPDHIDDELDSFEQLNFSKDSNVINLNLKQSKDLQRRLTQNLLGISNHYQLLSNGSQERANVIEMNTNLKQMTADGVLKLAGGAGTSRNGEFSQGSTLQRYNSQQSLIQPQIANGQIMGGQLFLQRIVSSHQNGSSSGESERSSVKSMTTMQSRGSNNHQIPKPTQVSRNLNGVISASNSQRMSCLPVHVITTDGRNKLATGNLTERPSNNDAEYELKKSNSQLQIKLKRQSINFIKKEGSSDNSTIRGSLVMRNDNSTIIRQSDNWGSNLNDQIFATIREMAKKPSNVEVLNYRESLKEQLSDQTGDRKQNQMSQLMMKKRLVEQMRKAKLFSQWVKLMRFKLLLKVYGMQIYQRFNRLDQKLKRRVFRVKHFHMSIWKNRVTKLRIQSQVMPRLFYNVHKLALKLVFNQILNHSI